MTAKKSLVLFALVAGAAFGMAALPSVASAQQADVIRGRITGPDSLPLGQIQVAATSISGNVTRTARTDSNGRFTITFPGGDGDYMITVSAIGYAVKRFEVKRTADEEILVADARLARIDAILDAVQVNAQRPRVSRNDVPADVSGTERPISNAAVPADMLGDLAAMAATLPGVQAVTGADGSSGYSVLGLGADQNNTTLNGMSFGGSGLPRDAAVSSSVITSPYDVSRGGFSGAQMSLRTRSGSNFLTRGMSLNIDAPQLQWSDRAARSLGQEYSNISLGGAVSGPVKFDHSFYNVSYQLGRRSSDLNTLLSTDAGGFGAAGVASDSVTRLLSLLQARGVPFTVSRAPSSRIGDQGSVFGSIDIAPPSSSTGQAVNISFNGNWNRQAPTSGLATELPSYSGERTGWRGGLQGRHSGYFKNAILTETSLAFSYSRNNANAFLAMPAGTVRVNSDLPDGTRSVQSLLFGGNQGLNNQQTTTSSSVLNQLSWFSVNNKHRLRLTSELRYETSQQESANNSLGTFVFNSLSDLEADRPASFSRQLGVRDRNVGQVVAGLSLGDAYRRTDRLQIQYGVRLDASRFNTRPTLNPEIETLFGVANDNVPSRIYVSPRVGFSWGYGTAAQVAGFEGAMRGPRAVVRGGVGVFQNTPSTGLISSALDNTGLPAAVQQIMCVGAAAPTPDWDAYATGPSSIPAQCADGTAGTVFANAAPGVTLLADDYASPRSVRSNLQWSGPVLSNRFSLQVEGTYSVNLNQQGITDLNFNGIQRFALTDEDGRPVFVQPSSIVAATGAVAPLESRKSPDYSRVTEIGSDLRSESRQLMLRLSPVRFSAKLNWSLSYVLADVREQVRGFNSTAGNPLTTEWARSGFSSRHQLTYNVGYNFFDFVRINWFGSFRSGSRFTPTISGDVNGDGYSNDRAFIFDPATADPAIAAAMRELLDNGSPAAKSCLSAQLGQLAGRNSCEGPWYSTASMSLTFNPLKVRMPHRSSLSFSLSNPLGAADLLLNGSDKLRGWGQPSFPDQSLLYVRGFDPAANRFRYEVNERFGSTNRALGGIRNPVTLTAMLRFDLGPMRERQMLTQQLDRGRRNEGSKVPEAMLRLMYNGGGLLNPMATILRQQDSLRLTAPQADSIAMLNRTYTIRADAIWTPLAKSFAELPDNYDRDAVYDRYLRARKETIDMLTRLAPSIKGLLKDEQLRKLPAFVASYLEPRYLASIRNGTATFTNNFSGFSGMDGAIMTAGGGGFIRTGDGGITIIR